MRVGGWVEGRGSEGVIAIGELWGVNRCVCVHTTVTWPLRHHRVPEMTLEQDIAYSDVYLYVCACMCMCMRVYACVCVCAYVCTRVSVSVCTCTVYVRVRLCACVRVYVYVRLHTHM